MPFFLLFVMFLPRVKRVFGRPKVKPAAATEQVSNEPASPGNGALDQHFDLCTAMLDRGLLKPCRRYRRLGRTVDRPARRPAFRHQMRLNNFARATNALDTIARFRNKD